jgi:hypothetical protein
MMRRSRFPLLPAPPLVLVTPLLERQGADPFLSFLEADIRKDEAHHLAASKRDPRLGLFLMGELVRYRVVTPQVANE